MQAQGNITPPPVVFKPGVFSSYGNGWTQLWRHFLVLFLIGLVYFVLNLIISIPQWIVEGIIPYDYPALIAASGVLSIISLLYNIFFIYPLGYGQSYAYLRAARNENVEVLDMFAVFKNYWSAVLASVLIFLIMAAIGGVMAILSLFFVFGGIFFWFLIFVAGTIAFIIIGCKLAFVPYLVVDKRMKATEAIKESWQLTNGYAGKVFLIGLMGIPIVIAGLICLLIGVIVSIMWINAALASLYYAVSMKRQKEKESEVPGNALPF